MKKFAHLLSSLLLAALVLTGCGQNQPEVTSPTEGIQTFPTTAAKPTTPKMPVTDISTPSGTISSDQELYQTADQVLAEKYGLTDLSNYKSHINRYSDTDATVCYALSFCGYHTRAEITVDFNQDGTVSRIRRNDEEYTRYLPFLTEAAVQAAVEKLDRQAKAYNDVNPYSWQIDQEGYLCLGVEIIVEYDTPKTDSQGNPIYGCGCDHDHIFLRERVCHYT